MELSKDKIIKINLSKFEELGMSDDYFTSIYLTLLLLAEDEDDNRGIVKFSYRIAESLFHIGFQKYKKLLNEMIKLGYIEYFKPNYKNKGGSTYIKLLHYDKICNIKKIKI